MRSIRAYLVVWLVGGLAVGIAAVLVAAFLLTRAQIGTAFDDELKQVAHAVLRRRGGRGTPEIAYGALSLDPAARSVTFRGAAVELSPREFSVLQVLLVEPGAVVSRSRLEDAVYGWGEEIGSNSIEVHLHHLRRKLAPDIIRNVRGVGYRIARLD